MLRFAKRATQSLLFATSKTQKRFNTKDVKVAQMQQQTQDKAQKRSKMYMILSGLAVIVGTIELGYIIGMVNFIIYILQEPKMSIGDTLRSIIYGYPYRNYLDLRKGTFLENLEANGVYLPLERHVRKKTLLNTHLSFT